MTTNNQYRLSLATHSRLILNIHVNWQAG